MDTVLTALLAGVTETDSIVNVKGRADKEDLENPEVLCIECGGSGQIQLNNFDHHSADTLPSACMQMARVKNIEDPFLLELIEYVDKVDRALPIEFIAPFPSLSSLFSGMMLLKKNTERLLCGIEIFKTVIRKKIDPFVTMPERPEWYEYIDAKQRNHASLMKFLKNAEFRKTPNGFKIGFSSHHAIGGIKALHDKGCDIVILHHDAFGENRISKFTIASKSIALRPLVDAFTEFEDGWGGHSTIIGSPLESGSSLSKEQVIQTVIRQLQQRSCHEK
jgi:hypothetical protein